MEICRETWIDLRTLEMDINPSCSSKKKFEVAHDKIEKYWDWLDKGERTANEILVLCANVYDDSLIGDSAFISYEDNNSSSETDGSSTDDENSSESEEGMKNCRR